MTLILVDGMVADAHVWGVVQMPSLFEQYLSGLGREKICFHKTLATALASLCTVATRRSLHPSSMTLQSRSYRGLEWRFEMEGIK